MDELQAQVLHIFVQEGADLLDTLDRTLLEIEEDPHSRELLAQFMRTAHTLKGSAGTVGFPAFSDTAHALEDVVDGLRKRAIPPSPRLFDQLSRSVDALTKALGSLSSAAAEPETELKRIEEELRALTAPAAQADAQSSNAKAVSSDFQLGEYDHIRIGVARKRGQRLFRVELPISSGMASPATVAGELTKLMRQHGDVIATEPKAAEFDVLLQRGRLLVLFGSLEDEAALREALYVENAAQIQIRPFDEAAPESVGRSAISLSGQDNTMRVEMTVLDELLRMTGEIVINRSRLETLATDFSVTLKDDSLHSEIVESAGGLGHVAAQLQATIMRARLVPVDRLFRTMKRCVRDTSRWLGRSVRLMTQGEQTLIDQGLLEGLRPPLLELLQVLVVGAAPEGIDIQTTILVASERRGDAVHIQIDTDSKEADPRDIRPLHQEIRLLRGQFIVGQGALGARYSLSFPATQVILPAIVVEAGDELYAFPLEIVHETVPLKHLPLSTVVGGRTAMLRGAALPLVYLYEELRVAHATTTDEAFVIVVGQDNELVGVVVERLVGKRVVVRKPLGNRFSAVHTFSGATILADGRIALILDVPQLIAQAQRRTSSASHGARAKSTRDDAAIAAAQGGAP